MTTNPNGGNYLRYANSTTGELSVAGASYGPGGAGAIISYTIESTELGLILIAGTVHGINWLGIHESEPYLESELRGDFPQAEVVRDDDGLRELAGKVIAFVGYSQASLDLPLDIRATPFQLAVWRELCAIPPGETRSYGEIARRLGDGHRARAVGHANGSNPLALLIPCHRAIGANGKLTGYRWGLEYKQRILDYERRQKIDSAALRL
ncbi:MAG TPA: methylated-DNA--[protein]-cysteine S-methyltransferase [Candidatus Binataceae bacterium]|nr:methylated-DNA--[protein]-cysteine S-methyltransferase [Candidatus Binataceae bacterium]